MRLSYCAKTAEVLISEPSLRGCSTPWLARGCNKPMQRIRSLSTCCSANKGQFSPVRGSSIGRGTVARGVSSVASTESGSKSSLSYRTVPFKKESAAHIAQEVPPFTYYLFGEQAQPNPYEGVPLDRAIFPGLQLPSKSAVLSEPQFSKLENGLRIVSVDKGGLTSSLALFVDVGTRWEEPHEAGVSNMIELVAYRSTAHLSYLRTVKSIEALGASASCQAGREHIAYFGEILRGKAPLLIPMIVGNILFPRLLDWEIRDCHRYVHKGLQRLQEKPESLLTEIVHAAAYGNASLGRQLLAGDRSLKYFDGHTIRNFMLKHFSPANMVFCGVNIDHEEMCKWLMRAFVDYHAIPPVSRQKVSARYRGGDLRERLNITHCHAVIAFETRGWNSNDLEVATLLHTLMGGGGSFSTGGPGKGLHSRIYTEVLNRHDWVESCCAFNTMYSDSGLFGLYAVFDPPQAEEAVAVMTEQLKRMRSATVEELKRAKACLQASIFMNLESRNVLCEDIARQVMMSDRVVSGAEFARRIEAISLNDLQKFCDRLLSGPPTFAAVGDIDALPHSNELMGSISSTLSRKQ